MTIFLIILGLVSLAWLIGSAVVIVRMYRAGIHSPSEMALSTIFWPIAALISWLWSLGK